MSCFRAETSPTQFRTKAGFMGLACLPACLHACSDDENRTDVIDIWHAHAHALHCACVTPSKSAPNGARVRPEKLEM